MDCQSNRKVSREETSEFTRTKGVKEHEVSAKTGQGVDGVFMEMARELVKIHPKVDPVVVKNPVIEDLKKRKSEFKIKSGTDHVEKKKGCC